MSSIKKEIIVNASQEKAFRVFTEKMDLWWPKTHHIGKAPMTGLILEPRKDGRWYSTHEDGSEANVGKVLVWQPSDLLILAWQINGKFQYDPALITEVELRFIAEGPAVTRIVFEHRNMELMGDGKAVENMDNGWGQILDLYRNAAPQ